MKLVHVLVIDDSLFRRRKLVECLDSDARINVLGIDQNSTVGLEKIRSFSPDIVLVDEKISGENYEEFLKKINCKSPLPVMVLSSVEANIDLSKWQENFKGFVDYLFIPSKLSTRNINELRSELLEKVIQVSKRNLQGLGERKASFLKATGRKRRSNSIVVIGASTGGPRALQKILSDLPRDFPAPILIVQHMPSNFTKSLAERLNSRSLLKVKEAESGEKLYTGVAYIAPGDFHMKVKEENESLTIELTKFPENLIYRPSVDILFQSVASIDNVYVVAIILTGMGKDGSKGIREIKKNNASVTIIAESKETSIVYGMPKAAIETGTVDEVIHLQNITKRMLEIIQCE